METDDDDDDRHNDAKLHDDDDDERKSKSIEEEKPLEQLQHSSSLMERDEDGATPIHYAAARGDNDALSWLLRKGWQEGTRERDRGREIDLV